ncbi:hypothetical protein [Tuanshanicoccus lijuaniae]|uniref:hypothetical protein n=1 Tax=Aerococcaceae bacterium zg-1292 TaxID=2774330 RepID=UPI001BD8DE23|nr:hypothetical protein [Aerococcaceae bacterium zg-A91]MBS4457250.1 hypothetical protein [Aerococcaceae bacterium zg-BR33]
MNLIRITVSRRELHGSSGLADIKRAIQNLLMNACEHNLNGTQIGDAATNRVAFSR